MPRIRVGIVKNLAKKPLAMHIPLMHHAKLPRNMHTGKWPNPARGGVLPKITLPPTYTPNTSHGIPKVPSAPGKHRKAPKAWDGGNSSPSRLTMQVHRSRPYRYN